MMTDDPQTPLRMLDLATEALMKINGTHVRYTVALVALLLGFAFSITLSDRGFLFQSQAPDALAQDTATPDEYDLQALTIFNRVLLQMKDNYVEPERIDPSYMLVKTIDRVQNTVPEVVAMFNAAHDDSPTEVEIHVGTASESFDLTGVETLWEMSFKLREVFRFLQDNLDPDEIDLRDVEYAAINGMLATLDPHSVLLTPDIYLEMQTSNRGSFGGLGIVISIRDGQLTVISPIEDTPADRAGIRAGDKIVKINDESTVNMPLDEAVSRLRGPPGSEVQIEVMRDGWNEPHEFTLERQIIEIESVTHQALGDGIGYVQISNFQATTHDALLEALEALRDEMGDIDGLVLDLRNNPGGLLQQAIAISDTFLSEGPIVTTVGIGDRLREENHANESDTEPLYPIVVLVNPGSASASEIVAGALKNHDRAIVVGDQTFGKGSVQVLYEFQDGSALKLTVAQYLTPGDISIQGVGITPDIQVFPSAITEEMIDLYPGEASVVREGDLETSLTSDRVSDNSERPSAIVRYYYEPEETDPNAIEDPDAFEMDFEIEFAQSLLEAAGDVWERDAMLARVDDAVDEARDEQLVQIQEALRNRNVDWTDGDNVIQPITLNVETSTESMTVEAGEDMNLTVTVTNDGDRALHQVRAVSHSSYGVFDDREFVFGKLEPGESRSWTVDLTIPVEDPTRLEEIRFSTFADEIDLAEDEAVHVLVNGRERPHWGITYALDDSEGGNGDGRLQVGETVGFIMDVTNTGDGDADETIFILRNQSDSAIFLNVGRETVDGLPAGEQRRAIFEFTVQEAMEDGNVRLDAEVYDTVFREFLHEELVLPVEDSAAVPQTRTGVMELINDAALLGGSFEGAPVVARATSGTLVSIDRYIDDWYHVTWNDGQGWISEDDVAMREGAAPSEAGVVAAVHYQAPLIEIDREVVETDASEFTINGILSDDRNVRDFYVVVMNQLDGRRTQSIKHAYAYLGVPSATFSEDVPLMPGMNRITVVARDDEQAISSEVQFVYRHD